MASAPLPKLFFFDGDRAEQGLPPEQFALASLEQLSTTVTAYYGSKPVWQDEQWESNRQQIEATIADYYTEQIGTLWAMHPSLWRAFLKTGQAALSISHQHYYGHVENCVGFPVITDTSERLVLEGYKQLPLAHELGHFLDSWSPEYTPESSRSPQQSHHQHSTNHLFTTILSLDKQLYPDGVSDFIERYHRLSYPDSCDWREQERFAVAVGYYFGPHQKPHMQSRTLQAYMDQVVGMDIAILDSDLPDAHKHQLREILHRHTNQHTEATHESPLEALKLRRRMVRQQGIEPTRSATPEPAEAPSAEQQAQPEEYGGIGEPALRWTSRHSPLLLTPKWSPTAEEAAFADARDRYDTLSQTQPQPVQQMALVRKELEQMVIDRIHNAVRAAQAEMAQTGIALPEAVLQHGHGRKI